VVLRLCMACVPESSEICWHQWAWYSRLAAHVPHVAWFRGTAVGVQQKLMRHADIRTTMNIYGDAVTSDMTEAHGKIVSLALNGSRMDRKPS